MRFAALVLACLWPCALWSQSQTTHQFYVDLHSVSTVGLAEEGSSETTPHSLNKFGITCGNEFTLRGPLRLALEFYYYDNKLVVAEEGDDRFELHQCFGANLKPGLSYGTFKTFAIGGINAVYLFDKNERSGSQIDRFDVVVLGSNNSVKSQRTCGFHWASFIRSSSGQASTRRPL